MCMSVCVCAHARACYCACAFALVCASACACICVYTLFIRAIIIEPIWLRWKIAEVSLYESTLYTEATFYRMVSVGLNNSSFVYMWDWFFCLALLFLNIFFHLKVINVLSRSAILGNITKGEYMCLKKITSYSS